MSSSKHSAAGANAGFGYQFERALFWLAQSPSGAAIGIETTDDVAVSLKNGQLVLEQDKHSIRDNAEPYGNRSKDLWNTLSIWLGAIEAKEVAIESTHFFLVTNKVLPDCIAKQIGAAESSEAAAACVAELVKASKEPPETVGPMMERVLRPESRETLTALILRVKLFDGTQAAAGDALRTETLAHLQLPTWCGPTANSILDELSGWLHTSVLDLWRQKKPGWVQRDHFVNQVHAVLDRRKRQITRERAEHLISVPDSKVAQEKGQPFVKQLHLVTDDDAVVDTAIREFIRCYLEKMRLSQEGNVTDDDWKSFEGTLLARWNKIRTRVARIKAGTAEADVGFEILTETTEGHREKLAGSDTEQVYLTSGTYHRLADLLRVGWHPRYEDLMKELLKSP